MTAGVFTSDMLLQIAEGHENRYEPDWAKPLAFYLAQALEDDATPHLVHNALTDALDNIAEPYYLLRPGKTARRYLADGITKAIADELRRRETADE